MNTCRLLEQKFENTPSSVPLFLQLVVDLSQRRSRLYARPFRLGFVVDKMTLGHLSPSSSAFAHHYHFPNASYSFITDIILPLHLEASLNSSQFFLHVILLKSYSHVHIRALVLPLSYIILTNFPYCLGLFLSRRIVGYSG